MPRVGNRRRKARVQQKNIEEVSLVSLLPPGLISVVGSRKKLVVTPLDVLSFEEGRWSKQSRTWSPT